MLTILLRTDFRTAFAAAALVLAALPTLAQLRPPTGPSVVPPILPTQPTVDLPCGLYPTGDPKAPIWLDVSARGSGPFSIVLTVRGPAGNYAVSGAMATQFRLPAIEKLIVQPPASGVAKGPVNGKPSPLPVVIYEAAVTHPVTVPETEFAYVVKGTLDDGRAACGTARGVSLGAPPPVITTSYLALGSARVAIDLPANVHEARLWRADGSLAGEFKSRRAGTHLAGPQGLPGQTLTIDPGAPPFPYSTGARYQRQRASYGLSLELVWTEYSDGSGKQIRKSTGASVQGPAPVIGYADLHAHQFNYLGYGGHPTKYPRGRHFVGKAFGPVSTALAQCTPEHGIEGLDDLAEFTMRMVNELPLKPDHPIGGHGTGGYPAFDGWPNFDSFTHQQMHEDQLFRAHMLGLQLMVTHASNNEWMCTNLNKVNAFDKALAATTLVAALSTAPADPLAAGTAAVTSVGATLGPKLFAALTTSDPECNDVSAVQYQIDEAYAMQADIDRRSGGPGTGWYRIVRNPDEARGVIAKGKLAVVLGVEVDNLFGCRAGGSCSAAYVDAMVDNYARQGVRHFFPIHFYDNLFGGSANQNFLISSRLSNPSPKRDCAVEGYAYDGGHCNANGLTPLGAGLVRTLIDRGLIIDVDHLSARSFADVMSIVSPKKYPVVSSHSGFTEISRNESSNEGNHTPIDVAKILNVGGMFSVIAHQGELGDIVPPTWPAASTQTRVQHACGNTSETTVQAYLYAADRSGGGPVGFGTDFNGFAGWPGPRFGPNACPNGRSPSYQPLPMLQYPFALRATGVNIFGVQATLGQRRYDYNFDGLAHIGMLPDMLADFQAMGLTREDLDPAFLGAEGYIRLWERATYRKPAL